MKIVHRFLVLAALLSISFIGTMSAQNAFLETDLVANSKPLIDSNGTLINVTIVTLLVPPTTSTFTFCGNQTSQFTMNSAVQVSFNPGQSCSDLVAVTPH